MPMGFHPPEERAVGGQSLKKCESAFQIMRNIPSNVLPIQ
jgi:hypothetical protein